MYKAELRTVINVKRWFVGKWHRVVERCVTAMPGLLQYDDGIHPYMDTPGSMYDPHRSAQLGLQHHSPHVAHSMHQYHAPTNHVAPVANHVMGAAVPDVHKRDKDAIYG